MKRLLTAVSLAWACSWMAGVAKAESVSEATKSLRGRVASDDKEFPDLQGKELVKYLEARIKPRTFKKGADGIWPIYFYAILNKEAAAGPITVFIFDKKEPTEAIDARSLKNDLKTWVFRGRVELDENLGFNKGRTYELRIGQIFGKTSKIYAKFEVTLE